MSVRHGVVTALLCGAALAVAAPPAQADSGGGCAHGGVLSGVMVPGTGSAGQGIHREADVWGCSGPLLPGITSGHFTAELPWNALDSPTRGRFDWNDGSVSAVIGQPNGLWTVIDGPAAGHTFRFQLAGEMNVWWYHWPNSMQIESVSFLE
ncbi:hypothetical protein GPX89_43000 [Nocardia sp. ET3-3]|uniref:Uncharacterized protein n=1 Tax=Nocardia terrae TaxID=2675851 RepID=A0A7K1VBF6_9NOCA|nr:hypothetical protein [Nocardia terrae]MVU83984.1 hypothetical protein [Nocardia terrae]